MSKLSHSNPNLDDVLHEGNAHQALRTRTTPTLAEMRDWITHIVLKAYPKGPPIKDNNMSIAVVKALTEGQDEKVPPILPVG